MKRMASIALLIVCVGLWEAVETTRAEQAVQRSLLPGEYRVFLTASEGSHSGGKTEGRATLRIARADDTSPRTGERARDSISSAPLYGWIDANLGEVGAPLCSDAPHPSPRSTDPIYPGLLVIRVRYGPKGPFSGDREVPTILVGTLGNIRNGSMWLDGCGFAMYVLGWDGNCHVGLWSEWGKRRDGSGEFRLCTT